MHADSRPLIGLLAGLTLGSSALSQLLAVRGRFLVPAGLAVLGVSVVLLAAAGRRLEQPVAADAGQHQLPALGRASPSATVFNDVAGKVEPARHAQIISTVYVITYLGSAIPGDRHGCGGQRLGTADGGAFGSSFPSPQPVPASPSSPSAALPPAHHPSR